MHEARKQRQQAQALLSQTVAALKEQLPPPNSPNLADKMPQNISPYLLNRVLYYPRLNAYKYTFRPRYQYDSNGVFDSVPDWLERRSIWFKAENGRWRCFAGVKPSVQIAECSDRDIVKALTVEDHRQIFRQKAAGCIRRQIAEQHSTDEHIYRIRNQTSAENVYLDFSDAPPYISLILLSDHPTDWYLGNLQHTTIKRIVIQESGLSEGGMRFFGLPYYSVREEKSTQIADIQQLHEQCVLNNRDDAEFYPLGYTDKDFGEWFFRQPEKQFRHIVLTDAAPKNALLSATAGGEQPENAVLLNTVTKLRSGSRDTDLTNTAINNIEWKCDNVQQPASDSTTRIHCQAYLSDKLLSDEDLGGVVLSKNKLWLEHVNQYSLPDWAKQQLETTPKSNLREDTVVIDGKPYPLSCLWKGCPK
nr:hypothetical protein [uncultured Kingella sp.]